MDPENLYICIYTVYMKFKKCIYTLYMKFRKYLSICIYTMYMKYILSVYMMYIYTLYIQKYPSNCLYHIDI